MDIHRCRFVPYPPSTINVLAFSHSHIPRAKKDDVPLRLAIGRANGDIEIWNPLNGNWFQETILRGGEDRSVDGLVWTQDPDEEDADGKIIIGKLRLFSIGYTTTVTEWDLERGQPLRESSGNHGEIWCLAAQPHMTQDKKKAAGEDTWTGQNLITGCTDGALVLYSTADNDLKLERVLVRPSAKKAKIISVTFQDRNIAIAGCTDSTIRVFDTRNGNSLRSISLGSGPSGGPKEIIVWAVKCLPSGNIVSGDSTGELRIFDGKTYTLVQRVKSHKQDILSLATSADGSTIMSGGMDRRTVVYKQTGAKPRWAEVSHKRFHSHDVKTMTTFEGRGMSFVVSGGPDATPIVLPLREFGTENQRMLPALPQEPILHSAPAKRLMLSYWDREVSIWRINKSSKRKETVESESEAEDRTNNKKLVAKVLLKGEANITSTTISNNGGLLAVSTNLEVKLFKLRSRGPAEGETLKVSKIDLPKKLATVGAKLVQFSPDGRWLAIVQSDSRIVMTRVLGDVSQSSSTIRVMPKFASLVRLDRNIEKRTILGGLGRYERSINKIAFSSDSSILAVSDLAGYIDTWVLKGEEELADSDDEGASDASGAESDESDDEQEAKPTLVRGQLWTRNLSASSLPKLPAAAVVLSFRPSTSAGEDRLLVVTATSMVLEFEVLNGGLTKWSRSNPTSRFPEEFKGLIDQAMGCLWDVSGGKQTVWIYGTRWMFMFDLSRDFPAQVDMKSSSLSSRKRKHAAAQENLRKGTTGAGSKIPDHELTSGMSRKMQKIAEGESTEVAEFELRKNGHAEADEENDADEQDDKDTVLERLRRGQDVVVNGGSNGEGSSASSAPHWWHTYKYRPIMGVVPISSEDASSGIEVVLVERPDWELDLPPRYYGDQEWEKPGL